MFKKARNCFTDLISAPEGQDSNNFFHIYMKKIFLLLAMDYGTDIIYAIRPSVVRDVWSCADMMVVSPLLLCCGDALRTPHMFLSRLYSIQFLSNEITLCHVSTKFLNIIRVLNSGVALEQCSVRRASCLEFSSP